MTINYYVNSEIIFGRNSIKNLTRILSGHSAKTVMLVYDEGVKVAGIADKVMEILEDCNVEIVIFDKVLPNPTNELVEVAAELALVKKVDTFIAVGGGSSIDLAKAVNILMTNPAPIEQYGGIGNVTNKVLPLIAIPTTAGTSSEITNVSALTDTKKVCKYVIIDNKITPTQVIVDPEFTLTMPASVTAATGMDAITHAVESYISNMATPLTEYQSLEALRILFDNLPKVIENGEDIEAREQMMLGCIIAGFAFSNANLGLVHGIAHTLSAHYHLPHGMANACMLPYVTAFNAPSCPEKMMIMAKAIGLQQDVEGNPYLFADELKQMIKRLGIKTLSEQGISEISFDLISDDVLKEPVLNFNPRQGITKQDIIALLKDAL